MTGLRKKVWDPFRNLKEWAAESESEFPFMFTLSLILVAMIGMLSVCTITATTLLAIFLHRFSSWGGIVCVGWLSVVPLIAGFIGLLKVCIVWATFPDSPKQ